MITPSYFAQDYKSHNANPIARHLNSLMAAEARRFKGASESDDN